MKDVLKTSDRDPRDQRPSWASVWRIPFNRNCATHTSQSEAQACQATNNCAVDLPSSTTQRRGIPSGYKYFVHGLKSLSNPSPFSIMVAICEELLRNGFCSREHNGCSSHHNVFRCDTCRVFFTSQHNLFVHYETKRHTRKVEGNSVFVRCTVCKLTLASADHYPVHSQGRRHLKALKSQGSANDPGPEEVDTYPGATFCNICDIWAPDNSFSYHLNSRRHKKSMAYVAIKSAVNGAEKNKNGVIVSDEDGLDFGILDIPSRNSQQHEKRVYIENTNATAMLLTQIRVTSQFKSVGSQVHFNIPHQTENVTLAVGTKREIVVAFTPHGVRGRFVDRLELQFEDTALGIKFGITRPMSAIVGVKADYEVLRPKSIYVRPKRTPEEPMKNIVEGVPPPALHAIKWTSKLPMYPVPNDMIKLAYTEGKVSEIAQRVKNTFMPGLFASRTYGHHFDVMLWIEEERARQDLAKYNLQSASVDPSPGRYHTLEVDGLAEKRPSLIVTDVVFVQECGSAKDTWFEGHVHRLQQKSVHLHFGVKFRSIKGQKYKVRFQLNRLTLRRMHHALNTVFMRTDVLFPAAEHCARLAIPTRSQVDSIRCVDKKVGENPPQLQAVAAILHRPRGSVPFVVFGPPGTGKTVTVVEAIKQVLLADPKARVLACAPSNSASDIIAERLADLGKTAIFRLISPSRSKKGIPQPVLDRTRVNGDDVFVCPPPEELKTFRVVVSTCASAGTPSGIGVPRGHFTHIFIDEAGQAQEPEVMIGIKTIADNNTNIILSGDSKQLGPIVRSPVARELGLGKSYLDRMMESPIYDEDTGRGTTLVKLVKNWRSHPDILKFPNDEFYRSELEACGDPLITHSLLRWDMLPTKQFPIIFHGVCGKDMREASSPSFFNIEEASLVKTYVKNLLEDRRLRLKPQNVGVISPYNAQVHRIRNLLAPLSGQDGKNIKVGSVEEFQGQERRVIVLSTVRSSVDQVEFDLRHTLGFVANPRRFNVAVTRAQALLIVIGDPLVLSLDPLWKSFINYIHLGGGYTGKKIDWDPREPVDRSQRLDQQRQQTAAADLNDLVTRTRAMIIGEAEQLGDRNDDDELEANVDQPWREDE
ncbi:P-loop containing nucleoside triphosphate hydrolase protein [Rickenella mellea]|uniref:RNA helicase n=1 Tax=Rickenella mellea TaxID=50990 RepID=A0A4Y7QAR4_9AGAM|nr:P-loop containing nucleoside triphosphate hydrolase protein [Rickenella mellea]